MKTVSANTDYIAMAQDFAQANPMVAIYAGTLGLMAFFWITREWI